MTDFISLAYANQLTDLALEAAFIGLVMGMLWPHD
jgi:hypothetical protein